MDEVRSKWPLHLLVWNDDVEGLKKAVEEEEAKAAINAVGYPGVLEQERELFTGRLSWANASHAGSHPGKV